MEEILILDEKHQTLVRKPLKEIMVNDIWLEGARYVFYMRDEQSIDPRFWDGLMRRYTEMHIGGVTYLKDCVRLNPPC